MTIKVLIADDHPQVREGLKRMLADAGIDVVEAATCEQAVRMAEGVTRLVGTATGPRDGLRQLVAGYLDVAARDRFGVVMGRMHERPVGPHPRWSCQLAVPVESIGELIGWLALECKGLTIFIHAEAGDVIADHTEHTMWMGEMLALDLSAL